MYLQFFPDQDEIFPSPFRAKVAFFIEADQEAWIEWAGTFWSTKFYSDHLMNPPSPGETVTVVGRRGNSLLIVVEPALNDFRYVVQENQIDSIDTLESKMQPH